MLVEIDLCEESLREMDEDHVTRLFGKVAEAVKNGVHHIYLPLELYTHLKKLNIFPNSTCGAIEILGEKNSELGEYLKNKSLPKLTIKYFDIEHKSGTGNHFCIGYKNVLSGDYLLKPTVIVENIDSDGEFYDFALKEEVKRTGDDFSVVDYNFENTGGKSNTNNVLKAYSKKARVVVCIIDQDRVTPMSKLESQQRERAKILNNGKCVGFVKYTPGHELENFLPICIVEKLGKIINSHDLQRIKSLIEGQGKIDPRDCMWLFYDIKDGIKIKKSMNKFIVNNQFKLQQRDIDWLCKKYNTDESNLVKLTLPGFENKSKKAKKIIEKFLNDSNSKDDFVKYMNCIKDDFNYWEHHFGDWMNWLLWLGCCYDDLSVS